MYGLGRSGFPRGSKGSRREEDAPVIRRAARFCLDNSVLLVLGAVAGLIWANVAQWSYEQFAHFTFFESEWFGYPEHGTRIVSVHYVVNDLLMALFFALAGKEVWEAVLPNGALHDPRKAASPILATVGGMVGPALVYLLGALAIGQLAELGQGWAIPCATDIAFSYLVARVVFGGAHPAIPFLLLLAIVDDALGLIILAVFYPVAPVQFAWMVLPVGAVFFGLALRRVGVQSFWLYLLGPGVLSWCGFALAGLHPALGLLPIIPTLPHAQTDLGIFMAKEVERQDALSEFEHWWKNPVELILCLFGLLNAGVVLGSVGAPTVLVLAGLWIGKPLGIVTAGWLAARMFRLPLPEGMTQADLFVVGCAASIGFTVALFVSVVAFPAGPIQDAAKMGALASVGAAGVTVVAARTLGVRRQFGAHRLAVVEH
jgi:Na+:H+ antiporter, NhaA family